MSGLDNEEKEEEEGRWECLKQREKCLKGGMGGEERDRGETEYIRGTTRTLVWIQHIWDEEKLQS